MRTAVQLPLAMRVGQTAACLPECAPVLHQLCPRTATWARHLVQQLRMDSALIPVPTRGDDDNTPHLRFQCPALSLPPHSFIDLCWHGDPNVLTWLTFHLSLPGTGHNIGASLRAGRTCKGLPSRPTGGSGGDAGRGGGGAAAAAAQY